MERNDISILLTKIVTPTLTRSQALQTYSTERMHKTARIWLKKYSQNEQRRQEMYQKHVYVWKEKKKCKNATNAFLVFERYI